MNPHIIIAYATIIGISLFTIQAQREIGRQQIQTNNLLSQMYLTQVQSYSAQLNAGFIHSPQPR